MAHWQWKVVGILGLYLAFVTSVMLQVLFSRDNAAAAGKRRGRENAGAQKEGEWPGAVAQGTWT
jgi:hypothetical protein